MYFISNMQIFMGKNALFLQFITYTTILTAYLAMNW